MYTILTYDLFINIHNEDFYQFALCIFSLHGISLTSFLFFPTQIAALDSSSSYYLHSSDQPGQILVTQPLNGDNYATWSRAITMALEAKNKLGFIDGSLLKPEPNSPNFSHWIRCNSMVQSWLIHSTIPTIANSIIWINSARDIWLDLLTRFTQKNAPRIFEIRRTIANLSQGTKSIATYYT